MRVLLSTVCILVALLVSHVNCQDDESEGEGRWANMWKKFREAVKKFGEQVRALWDEFAKEIKQRAKDMSQWSSEMWESFKTQMNEWIDRRNDISDSEKEKMRDYVERLQMEQSE